MGTHHPPRPCFAHGFFYTAPLGVVCVFTEGEVYSYPGITATEWLEFKTKTKRGEQWNLATIMFNRPTATGVRIATIPTGWTDSF